MRKIYITLMTALLIVLISSCEKDNTCIYDSTGNGQLIRYPNTIRIDSAYTYAGDSLYNAWLNEYNNRMKYPMTRLNVEDEAFFCKEYTVKTTEPVIYQGRNYIYPGSILEGNSIADANYAPIIVSPRNPITVTTTLSHNTPIHTSRTIENPTLSKINDYVIDMVQDANFEQSEHFMYNYSRFTFYDEIKTAFSSNINTKRLFSSKSETTLEERALVSHKK